VKKLSHSLGSPFVLTLLVLIGSMVSPLFSENQKTDKPNAKQDDDGEGPDYYEGQDAPVKGTVTLEAVGAPLTTDADIDNDADANAAAPLWVDVLGNGSFSTAQDNNMEGRGVLRIGKEFAFSLPLNLYLKSQLDRNQLDFIWNNRVDAGAGVRLTLSHAFSLFLSTEMVAGEYLHSPYTSEASRNNRGRAPIPAGFLAEWRSLFWHQSKWGEAEMGYSLLRQRESIPSIGGSTNTSSDQTSDYQSFFMLLNPRAAMNIMENAGGNVAVYVTGMLRYNSLDLWWENFLSAGPGIAYQPWKPLNLWVKAENAEGFYFTGGREGEARPVSKWIYDFKIRAELKVNLASSTNLK